MNRNLSIGIVTLNAKFIHTAPSLRYLRNAARRAGHTNVWIREYIINQPLWKIAADIQALKPDVIGVSVYIWNRKESFQLIEMLRKQNPALSVAIGGPEVSFDVESGAHFTVIAGEGEKKWVEYLDFAARGESPPPEALRRWGDAAADPAADLIPPYIEEDFPNLRGRMVYLETSRGCPYHCSFCLSALDNTVRYFDDGRVRSQIEQLAAHGAGTIKFIDRTFNLKPARMLSFMQWLTRFGETSFHFEVAGDILTGELLDFLDTVPEGMFQFEIGVQSLNAATLNAIRRRQDNGRLLAASARLVRGGRVHVHADLIFGLPGENMEQSLASFATVFATRPHELQLGFLKFLPGAPIRELAAEHDYRFQSFPPYEIIVGKDLHPDDIIYLKKFADVFDMFYNSKRFEFSLDLLARTLTPVEIFDRLIHYIDEKSLLMESLSMDEQYRIYIEAFGLADDAAAMDLLQWDYLYHRRMYRLPGFMLTHLPAAADTRFQAWRGDGKTPLFPFLHEIALRDGAARLTRAPQPVYYAFVHPDKSGYLRRPTVERGE